MWNLINCDLELEIWGGIGFLRRCKCGLGFVSCRGIFFIMVYDSVLDVVYDEFEDDLDYEDGCEEEEEGEEVG